MDNRQTILEELSNISPLVESIGDSLPYSLPPSGYFNSLAGVILSRIRAENGLISPDLTDSTFSASDKPLTASDELNTLSPFLGKIDKRNPFTVPDGYFEGLSENILPGIKTAGLVNEEPEHYSPALNSVRQKNIYEVPEHYFRDLPGQMLNKAKHQEPLHKARESSNQQEQPVTGGLASINLNKQLQSAAEYRPSTGKREPAKVIPFRFSRKLVRYAAAAVAAGIIILSGYLAENGNLSVKKDQLANKENVVAIDPMAGIQKISDSEMINYLEIENTPLPDAAYFPVSLDLTGDDLKLMLADVSDESLQQYLLQYGNTQETLNN